MKFEEYSNSFSVDVTNIANISTYREEEQKLTYRKSYQSVWQRALRLLKDPQVKKRLNPSKSMPRKSIQLLSIERIQELKREQSVSRTKKFIISPLNLYYLLWQGLLTLITAYSLTFRLYFIAFNQEELFPLTICEIIIDLFFIVDLFIHFQVAYFDLDNNLVYSYSSIAENYLKTYFVPDALASIPLTLFNTHKSLRIIQIFSILFKIRHTSNVENALKSSQMLKNLMFMRSGIWKIFNFLFVLCLALHFSSCLFFLSAQLNEFDHNTWVLRYGYKDKLSSEQYLASFYWSITTLTTIGYGDISPYTLPERLMAILWMFTSLFFMALSIGYLNNMLSRMTIEENYNIKSADFLEDLSKHYKFSVSQKKQIRNFFINSSKRVEIVNRHQANHLLDLNIRTEISKHAFNGKLSEIFFFSSKCEAFRATVGILLNYSMAYEEKTMWIQQERPLEIIFLLSGRAKFDYNEIPFMFVNKDQYFGDIEILLKKTRIFSASILAGSEYLSMDLKTIRIIREEFRGYWKEMKLNAEKRIKRIISNIAEAVSVRDVKVFNDFKQLKSLIRKNYKILYSEVLDTEYYKNLQNFQHMLNDFNEAYKRLKLLLKNRKKKIEFFED